MATSSFDKTFIIRDAEAIKKLRHDLLHPKVISIQHRDYEAEKERTIHLLKQRLLLK